ncbi:MAG: glycosyltransferase family 4 protein [Candidatus Omnitrophica bacterium]|nr:glycosyltransferase family 4 protein [Candidatus Omnitrophota bacterium]
MKIKILALVTDTFGYSGGIAQFNRDLLGSLASLRDSFEVVVLPRRNGTVLKEARTFYSLKAFDVLRRQGPFQLIFCGHIFMAPLALFLSRVFRKPFVLCLYGVEGWKKPGRCARWAAERADRVIAISRHTRRKFLSWANIEPWRVKVLPCVVSEKFGPGPKRGDLLDRFGLKGKKIILTVSRLAAGERYKGHEKVFAVLPRLAEQYPDLAYVIVGDGDDRVRLEETAGRLGISDKVFFTGSIDSSEIADIYRLADVFVMPSVGEGFGIAFLEAVASGVPVIGGRGDGGFDALLEGRLGRLVDPENSRELEQALRDGLDRLIHSDRRLLHQFSRQRFTEHLETILEGNRP